MNLSILKPAPGSVKTTKRIGRGQGSGRGGTSTRGHKGAKSRSGYSRKAGFEGGQMPLYRRVPKFGFKPLNKVAFQPINLGTLEVLAEKIGVTVITVDILVVNGLASKNSPVKILAQGELTKGLEITAHAFSQSAIEAIEKVGGKVNTL